LTLSGPPAIIGKHMKDSVELALDHLNHKSFTLGLGLGASQPVIMALLYDPRRRDYAALCYSRRIRSGAERCPRGQFD